MRLFAISKSSGTRGRSMIMTRSSKATGSNQSHREGWEANRHDSAQVLYGSHLPYDVPASFIGDRDHPLPYDLSPFAPK